MNRRDFIASTMAGAALAASSSPLRAQSPQGRKPALMKLGCQSGPTSDERLQFFARHGVKNICGVPPSKDRKLGYPTVDELMQLKERAAKWDIRIDMLTPPFLASTHIDRTERPAIMLGQSPERDRDIEQFQNLIHNCAKAEIPVWIPYSHGSTKLLVTNSNVANKSNTSSGCVQLSNTARESAKGSNADTAAPT